MTKKEFSLFCAAMRTYFPKEKILPNEQAMELWYLQLQDIPYEIATLTLNKWVANNQWSPTIADIRASATEFTKGTIPDWGLAWETVMKAISHYGAYRAEEAVAALDGLTKECVERLGFYNLCMSENLGVERANFRIVYEQLAERKRMEMQMPPKLLEAIQGVQESIEVKRLAKEVERLEVKE